jgi:hypothetical protein
MLPVRLTTSVNGRDCADTLGLYALVQWEMPILFDVSALKFSSPSAVVTEAAIFFETLLTSNKTALMMEAIYISETSVNFYEITRSSVP